MRDKFIPAMKSAFGSKRKARKIQVDDEDDEDTKDTKDLAGANQSANLCKFLKPLSIDKANL